MLHVEEIRAMGPSAPVNLSVTFQNITNSIVSLAAFGSKRKDAPEFIAATKALIGLVSGFNIPDLFPAWTPVLAKLTGMTRSLKDIHNTVDTIIQEVIEERKAIRLHKIKTGAKHVDENLLDVLVGLQEKGGLGFDLTDSIIKAIILVVTNKPHQVITKGLSICSSKVEAQLIHVMQDIFAGGTGTPGSAMEWAMSELMRNPVVMKILQGQLREAFRGRKF